MRARERTHVHAIAHNGSAESMEHRYRPGYFEFIATLVETERVRERNEERWMRVKWYKKATTNIVVCLWQCEREIVLHIENKMRWLMELDARARKIYVFRSGRMQQCAQIHFSCAFLWLILLLSSTGDYSRSRLSKCSKHRARNSRRFVSAHFSPLLLLLFHADMSKLKWL